MFTQPPPPAILVLEDDVEVARVIRAELEPSFQVVHATNYVEALDQLYRPTPVVAVVAHHNVRQGHGGAQFMVEVARVRPEAARVLYSRSELAANESLPFAHAFVHRPWSAGEMIRVLVGLLQAPRAADA